MKAYTFNSDKIVEHLNSSKFRITILNFGKMWTMVAFSQKGQIEAFLQESQDQQSAKVPTGNHDLMSGDPHCKVQKIGINW